MLRIVLTILLVTLPAGCADPGLGPRPGTELLAPQKVFLDPGAARKMINDYRGRKGLPPVVLNDQLAKAAKRHSEDLARHDRIAHKGSDGSDPWIRVKRTGYRPRLAAENVGAGQTSLAEVFRGWQASPGHDKNLLLPDATHMGIALVQNPNTQYKTFWTLVLGTPL